MRSPRIFSAVMMGVLMAVPRLAAACPSCMGRDDQGYLLKIMLPVGMFLLFPFVIFLVLFMITRRMQSREKAHEA